MTIFSDGDRSGARESNETAFGSITVFLDANFNGVADALVAKQPELVITDLYLDKTKPQGLEIVQRARALSPPARTHDRASGSGGGGSG